MKTIRQKKIVRRTPHSLNITSTGDYEFIPESPCSWAEGTRITQVFRDSKTRVCDFADTEGKFKYRSIQIMGKDTGNPFLCDMVIHVFPDGTIDVERNTDI